MTARSFTSTQSAPLRRGEEFGEAHREQVAATLDSYDALFAGRHPDAARIANEVGDAALRAVDQWAPDLAQELRGLAAAADQPLSRLGSANARTEVLAALGARTRGECSTVVHLGDEFTAPIAMQNWDWFAGMADNWLVWTIPHEDGRTTTTVTEYGLVGKIGINSAGVGVLFNILHHRTDGTVPAAVPVHMIARQVLDTAADANQALLTIAGAPVSASTALTVVTGGPAGRTAICAEVHPDGPAFVLPTPDGLLLHTNHFLDAHAAAGDTEPREAPDTLVRFEVLQRSLHARRDKLTPDTVREILSSHDGATGALCCHPAPDEVLDEQYATLATVELDFDNRAVAVTPGPPCGHALTKD